MKEATAMEMVVLLLVSWATSSAGATYRPVRVNRNETATLPCWELTDPEQLHFWLTPNETIIGPTVVNSGAKYELFDDGSLIVKTSVKEDGGRYVCFSNDGGHVRKISIHLEVIDVSYIPEIDDWQSNLVRATIAAAVTCFFLLSSCAVHHFRWNGEHHKEEISAKKRDFRSSDSIELDDCGRKGSAGFINHSCVVGEDHESRTKL